MKQKSFVYFNDHDNHVGRWPVRARRDLRGMCQGWSQPRPAHIHPCQGDTMFKDKTHVRTREYTPIQSILDSQWSARGDIWSLRKPSAPHFPSSSLVSVSRCQWPVSDVTTCCDQACTPGGYLDQSPVLECGASAGSDRQKNITLIMAKRILL